MTQGKFVLVLLHSWPSLRNNFLQSYYESCIAGAVYLVRCPTRFFRSGKEITIQSRHRRHFALCRAICYGTPIPPLFRTSRRIWQAPWTSYCRQEIKSSSSLLMVPAREWWCVARWSIYISMDFVDIQNSFLNLDSWSLCNCWLRPGHKCQRCVCCSETFLSKGASGQLRILPWLVGYLNYIVRLPNEKDDNIGIL